MARFYGEIQGKAKTKATRLGSAASGLIGHVRGWDIGVEVSCYVDDKGNDIVTVYLTSGSNAKLPSKYLGTFNAEDLK